MRLIPRDPLIRPVAFPVLPRFSLYKSAPDQGIAGNTTQKVTWSGENDPSHGCWFDSSNNRIYILRAGTWEISAHWVFAVGSTPERCRMILYRNGTGIKTVTADYYYGGTCSNGLIHRPYLAAGDYIETYGGDAASANVTVYAAAAVFSGRLVSE